MGWDLAQRGKIRDGTVAAYLLAYEHELIRAAFRFFPPKRYDFFSDV